MNKKIRSTKHHGRAKAGFWDRTEPAPAVISVRHPVSRVGRSLAFLRRLLGMGPRKP